MNCNEMEPLMADAVGEELRDADRAAFDAHLAECASCRSEYETLRGAMQAMRGVASPARVSVRREGDRLVISEGRAAALAPRIRRPASVFRYAASVLIAFLAGYVLHAGIMFRDRADNSNPPPQIVAATPSLQEALVAAHQQSPQSSDFAKLIMAMSQRS